MALKLKDSELDKLLDDVVSELNEAFQGLDSKLTKSEYKNEASMEKAGPVDPEASSPAAEPAEASDDASAMPEGDVSASASPEMAPAHDGDVDMGGDALTPEALQMEYEKLPPEELQMHKQALEAALAKMGGGMGAPDMGSAPPAPEAPAAPPAPAMKSEKASKEFEDLKKSSEAEIISLKEDIEILAKSLKTLVETPVRKAIVSIDELPKAEEKKEPKDSYTPGEFWGKLKEVAKRPDLKKSERQLIMDIYDRRVSPEVAAKHLAKLFAD